MSTHHSSKKDWEEIERARLSSCFLKEKYESLPDEEKVRRVKRLERIFNERIAGMPEEECEVLLNYWASQTVAMDGVVEKAPILKLDRWFTSLSSKKGTPALAGINPEGTCFTFDYGLLFAPEEVLEELCAHELAHAFFRASKLDFQGGAIAPGVAETYTEHIQSEEQAVRDKVKQWGFNKEYLVTLWTDAVEIGKDDWKEIYKKDKMYFEAGGI